MSDKLVQEHLDNVASSIVYFVKNELGATPTDDQMRLLNAVQSAVDGDGKRDISVRSGHGTGKTSALSWVILWIGLTKEDSKIPVTAPVAPQLLNLLIPEVRKWANKMSDELQSLVEVQSADVKFQNGNNCFARTARKENSEALAGVHASFVCYIVDEASGVPQEIFDVIEGALTGENYIFIMTSNPTRTVGAFYDSHNKKKKSYATLHFSSRTSANVNVKWIDKMEQKYGVESDVVRVRVDGEFPLSSTDSLFTTTLINSARERTDIEKNSLRTWALDVARFGDDSSELTERVGGELKHLSSYSKIDTMVLATNIAFKYNQSTTKPLAIFVDGSGVGGGVVDRLRQLGLPIVDVIYSEKAQDNMYLNLRTEMYHALKEFLKYGRLDCDDDTEEELLATTYTYTQDGRKIKLISKDEIKSIIKRSPDKADSYAMHFAVPISNEYFEKLSNDNETEDYEELSVW